MAKKDKVHVETAEGTFVNNSTCYTTEIHSFSENTCSSDYTQFSYSSVENKDDYSKENVLSVSMNPVPHVQSYSSFLSIIPTHNQPCISTQPIDSLSSIDFLLQDDMTIDSLDITSNPLTTTSINYHYNTTIDYPIKDVNNDMSFNKRQFHEDTENQSILNDLYGVNNQDSFLYPDYQKPESTPPILLSSTNYISHPIVVDQNSEFLSEEVPSSSVLPPVCLSRENPSDLILNPSTTCSKLRKKKKRPQKHERKERGSNFPKTVKDRMKLLFTFIQYHYPQLNTKQISDVVEAIVRREYPDLSLTSSFLTYFYTHKSELAQLSIKNHFS